MVVLKSVLYYVSGSWLRFLINDRCSVVMITLGQVIAYGIGAGFFHVKSGWRWMVGLGAVPAGVQLIFLFFLPKSRAFIHVAVVMGYDLTVVFVCTARILVRRGNMEAATKVLGVVYQFATAEQVTLKAKILQASVQRSIYITEHTTFLQRLGSVFLNPVNRRALSAWPPSFLHIFLLTTLSFCSCGMRYASFPAAVRLQHPHVLLRYSIQSNRIR